MAGRGPSGQHQCHPLLLPPATGVRRRRVQAPRGGRILRRPSERSWPPGRDSYLRPRSPRKSRSLWARCARRCGRGHIGGLRGDPRCARANQERATTARARPARTGSCRAAPSISGCRSTGAAPFTFAGRARSRPFVCTSLLATGCHLFPRCCSATPQRSDQRKSSSVIDGGLMPCDSRDVVAHQFVTEPSERRRRGSSAIRNGRRFAASRSNSTPSPGRADGSR
jgi:hypothetical protein